MSHWFRGYCSYYFWDYFILIEWAKKKKKREQFTIKERSDSFLYGLNNSLPD
jgi:hypothetical protein